MIDNQRSAKLILEFMAAIRDEYESAIITPEQKKLRLLARKLCEWDGQDPDRVSMGYPGAAVMLDAKKTAAIINPCQPNWVLYLSDAQKAIELIDGYKPEEQ